MSEKRKKPSIYMSENLHKKLRIKCIELDTTLNAYTRAFLEYSLNLTESEVKLILDKYKDSDNE